MLFGAALKMNKPPTYGAIVVPNELKACARFKRLDAVFAGPNTATYGIRRNLQGRDPSGKDHQSNQEERIRRHGGSGNEQNGSRSHREKSGDHGPFVADPLHDLSHGNRKKKVCREKRELNEHDLRVAQVEDRLQVGNQNVVETGEKSPHKEQSRNDHQRALVGGWCPGRRGRCIWDIRCHKNRISLRGCQLLLHLL